MSGLFICLEGIDACGKTSTSSKVVDKLNEIGIRAIQLEKKGTTYPTDYLTTFMKNLKVLLWDSKNDDPVTEIPDAGWLYMHALWYKVMVEHLITPAQEKYDVVLIDSWYHKILSRFLLKKDFDHELANKVFEELPEGDSVFMFDVPPEVCWSRRSGFKASELGGHDFYEGSPETKFVQYQTLVRQQLLNKAIVNTNWNVLHTEKLNLEQVADEVVRRIKEKLGLSVHITKNESMGALS